MNGFIFLLDIGFLVGVISLSSYFLIWLIREKKTELEVGDFILRILLWVVIIIIAKNILYYSFTVPLFSPLRPFLSLILLIIDTCAVFLILYIGCKLKFWDTITNGIILIVFRRLLELFFYNVTLFISNSYFEGGFYFFIYI